MLCQLRGQGDPGQVVVGYRRVTAVTRDQDLVFARTRQEALPEGQAPRFERGVDPDLVFTLGKLLEPLMLHAETPRLRVIGGAVRDQVGLVRERVDVLSKLGERHSRIHGDAVAHYVQVVVAEVDHAATARVLDEGAPDVPLLRDGPIEDLGACRDVMELERDPLADPIEGLPYPIPRDAPADVKELFHEPEHLGPEFASIEAPRQIAHTLNRSGPMGHLLSPSRSGRGWGR